MRLVCVFVDFRQIRMRFGLLLFLNIESLLDQHLRIKLISKKKSELK